MRGAVSLMLVIHVTSNAAGHRSGDRVVMGIMSGNAAHYCASNAALGRDR